MYVFPLEFEPKTFLKKKKNRISFSVMIGLEAGDSNPGLLHHCQRCSPLGYIAIAVPVLFEHLYLVMHQSSGQ